MTTALIDADVICYQVAFALQKEIAWGDGLDPKVYVAEPDEVHRVTHRLVAAWKKQARCKDLMMVFSDRTPGALTFRHFIHPHYKANRTNDRPVLHDFIKEVLKDRYPNITIPGLEGDDTMGLMATGPTGDRYTIVSIDKDMLTVPARVVCPKKAKVPRKVSEREANYAWFFQTITGDVVDNYKGAPGAGPAAARQALSGARGVEGLWRATLDVFERQFKKERQYSRFVKETPFDEALMNARCARILRHGDYLSGLVNLWSPAPFRGEILAIDGGEHNV